MKVLVTGRSGSGKSTICRELQRLGLPACDADRVPGLAGWVDAGTHQSVEIDAGQPVDSKTTLWFWYEAVLRRLLDEHDDLYLCGSADNDLKFADVFDMVFVLTLPPDVQRQRILNRTEHDYGKLPEMLEQILAEQKEFVQKAAALGAIRIDAGRDPTAIAQDIVGLSHAG